MTIPAISSYAMPLASELPANKVSWEPAPGRAVLLIHDMQNYFIDAYTPEQSPVAELIANIRKLRLLCAERGIPVVYSAQPGGQSPEQRGKLRDFWGDGIGEGPYEKAIIQALAPAGDDIVLTKWRYNAFRKTNLAEILSGLGRDQLIVTGVYAHLGCLMTACDAFMQDMETFFVADGLADFTSAHHRMALEYAASRCSVVLTADQLASKLRPPASERREAKTAAAGSAMSMESIRAQVAELLHESPDELTDSENLVDRGFDSMRLMSLVERWRREGIEVDFVALAEYPTIADWWKLLSGQLEHNYPNLDYFTV